MLIFDSMKVPDKIYIDLVSDEKINLSGIILQLKIIAGRKNPYYIYTPKTNLEGKSELQKEDLIGQYDDHWESGQMDYDGYLKDANPIIEVTLYDKTWWRENKELVLAWTLLKNEKLKWKSKDEQFNYMISCTNDQFEASPLKININKTDTIRMKIKQRK